MTSFVGAKIDKPFEKGSSMPNYGETLEHKVAKRISSKLNFKNGSLILDVCSISNIHVEKLLKGGYKDSSNKDWNHSFSGEAEISIEAPNGNVSNTYRISGYVNIEGEDCKAICNDINVEKK